MFLYKNPSETRKYTVSFSGYLLSSEALQTAGLTIAITNIFTDGVSTSDIYVAGSLGFSGSDVSFRLTGGDDDVVYKLVLSTGGVTASGNIYTQQGYLYTAYEEQSLVSLSDLKTYMGINVSTNDAVLLALLRSATDFVEKYTCRKFVYKRYTDTYYPEQNWDRLKLNNYPVDTIESVVLDGITLDAASGGYANYIVEKEGYVRRLDGGVFPEAPFPTQVTYLAGFKPIPEDLRLAIMKIASADYNIRLQDGVLSEALGSYRVSYDKTSILTQDSRIREVLNQYTTRLL